MIPRLVPGQPLPPYSYVTGHFPHPVSDPAGHSHGIVPAHPNPLDPDAWEKSREYLYAIDLFNHGYYWEAHEAWETLWHACGRSGMTADFLKGLIKLAAAGVKVREGKVAGVRSHGQRAGELFQEVAHQLDAEQPSYLGLSLSALMHFAEDLTVRPLVLPATPVKAVAVIFDHVLRPQRQGA